MTVTVNTLGTNSRQIVIEGETGPTNIIDGVNTALVALGWTLFDTVSSGSRNCLVTKVYTAVNNDGPSPTTKYMILRYDAPRQYWSVSCCESWNASTNVATNEAWSGGRQILLPLQYSNCILYVFATARYACFMGSVRGEYGPWQGVFEFERAAAEDLAAKTVPCWGWTSSLTIGEPYGMYNTTMTSTSTTSISSGQTAVGFAVPRTATALTGISAAAYFNIITGIGEFPPAKPIIGVDWSSGGILQANNSHVGMLGTFGNNQPYAWDGTKTVISNMKPGGYTTTYPVGKVYGLKVVTQLGAVMNTTVVPVDANLFYSSTGSNTTHYLLGIHGGYKDKIVAGINRLTTTTTTVTTIGNTWQSVLVGGRYIYLATSTGFHKFDIQTNTVTYNILAAAAYFTVKFDGENSLYVTNGTTTVWKINLTNDTNTTLTAGTAVSGIALDDTYLYCGAYATVATTASIRRVTLSSFTETASWTITIGVGNTQYVSHMTAGDYAGYVYVAGLTRAARSTCRIVRILGSDGTNTSLAPTGSASNDSVGGQPLHFDGDNIIFVTGSNTAGTGNLTAIRVRISDFTILNEVIASASVTAALSLCSPVTERQGCLEPSSFAGLQHVPRNSSSTYMRIPYSDPKVTAGLQVMPADEVVLDSTNTGVGLGQPATDQCAFYAFSATVIARYTNTFSNYNFNGVQTANILVAQ